MELWQNAVQSMRTPEQREAMEKLYVNYVPDEGTMSFPAEKTGVDESDKKLHQLKEYGAQDVETETDLGWHLTRTNRGQLIAVAHNVTKFKLTLRGETGWDNVVGLLQEYGASCYSSAKLQAAGMYLTKERYEDLSDYLRETTKASYLLAEKIVGSQDNELLSILRVDEGAVGAHIVHWVEMEHTVHLALRPSAYLSLDTLLDMGNKYYDGSSPERAIKMRVGDLKEERSLEMERRYYRRTQSYYSFI